MANYVTVIIIVIAVLLLAACCFSCFFIIVHQSEAVLVERLGQFSRQLNSGLHCLVPIIDRPRQFAWKRTTVTKRGVLDIPTSSSRIDTREDIFSFLGQQVWTKDTIGVSINAFMLYEIHNPKVALYEVGNLATAIGNTAQSQMNEVFSELTFQECLTAQKHINGHLMEKFAPLFSSWGVTVHALEVLTISAPDIMQNLKAQMVAERRRRGEFILSESAREVQRLAAESEKQQRQNLGVAEQESIRKISEGSAEASVRMATAEATALSSIAKAVNVDGISQIDFSRSTKFVDMLRTGASKTQKRSYVMPYLISPLRSKVGQLDKTFGRHVLRSKHTRKDHSDDFDDLE
eukprot:gnl/Dysnectes_brevis/711_a784_8196.p1 GENE.gnl/Dysnectes_brevis/711_a784_8196~~gnl/Dysnectes_brevis/711_a784_8196.p1  ORF type:complete len:355 (-),score=16.47 gnl/Dysnectes_brevis/711_a784_8196:32-1075(-)